MSSNVGVWHTTLIDVYDGAGGYRDDSLDCLSALGCDSPLIVQPLSVEIPNDRAATQHVLRWEISSMVCTRWDPLVIS